MVGVRVLSVPDREKTDLSYGGYARNQGEILRPGVGNGQRAQPGTDGMVRAEDIYPAIGGVTAPGAVLDGSKTVFVVRRDTPFFDNPELEGRAVRLSQSPTGGYLTKRCCPAGVQTEDVWERATSVASRYYSESVRNQSCTYTPVFELLRNVGTQTNVQFQVEKQFSLGPELCEGFTSSLEPVSRSNFNAIFGAARELNRFSNEQIERLQTAAWEAATRTREGCLRYSRGSCVARGPVSGNLSKGKCRTAFRETFQRLGFLPPGAGGFPPGNEAASNYHPWLGSHGFTNVMSQGFDSATAPIGSILVYQGGEWGHIEAKVDTDAYCSDYCHTVPRDRQSSGGQRQLVGIYVPNRPIR